MISIEQCVPGTQVWYQPSEGVRFLAEITTPPVYVAIAQSHYTSLKLTTSKASYAMWKGVVQGLFATIPTVPLGTLFLDPKPAPEAPCIADELCTGCKTFVCDTCRRLRPACCGASDDHPDSCNDCANEKWAKSQGLEICPGCKAAVDPATCSCGAPRPPHGYCDNHGFIALGCNCMRSREPLAELCTCGCPAIKHSSSDCDNPLHEEHRYRRAQ